MANDNNIKTFSAVDIEKYHKGLLSPREMHAMEKAALDDPFLADALEGYTVAGVDVSADIAELKSRLAEKTQKTKVVTMYGSPKSGFPWMRVAAMVILIAGAGLISYQLLFKTKDKTVAHLEEKKQEDQKAPVVNEPSTTTTFANIDTARVPGNTDATIKEGEYKTTDLASGDVDIKNGETPVPLAETKQALKEGIANADNDGRTDKFFDVEVGISPIYKPRVDSSAFQKDVAVGNVPTLSNGQPRLNETAKKNETQGAVGYYHYNTRSAYEVNDKAKGKMVGVDRDSYTRNNFFRGQVTDNNGNPLPFANITNTADNVGTSTDAKGNFILVSPFDSVMNVQVKALGFENNRLQIRSDINNNQVKLQEDKSLAEVVLDTAYKRNLVRRSRDANMTFEEPEPVDGWGSYDSYLANNQMDIPEALEVKKNTGRDAVELSFEVNQNGDPIKIKVEKSLCDKCDKEAIRLVKEGPKWKRKAKRGKRTTVTVPFIKTE